MITLSCGKHLTLSFKPWVYLRIYLFGKIFEHGNCHWRLPKDPGTGKHYVMMPNQYRTFCRVDVDQLGELPALMASFNEHDYQARLSHDLTPPKPRHWQNKRNQKVREKMGVE